MIDIKRNLMIALVLMLSTVVGYANAEDAINTKKVRIVFENVQKGHSLVVKDVNGIILHKENVTKDGSLIKLFDFSKLIDGDYKIEVDKDYEVLVKSFTVRNHVVLFEAKEEVVIFKPVIKNKDNKVFISRINFDKSPLNVAIYYNDVQILEDTVVSDDELINKAYKLLASEKGDYKVVISNNGKSYIKDFTL